MFVKFLAVPSCVAGQYVFAGDCAVCIAGYEVCLPMTCVLSVLLGMKSILGGNVITNF